MTILSPSKDASVVKCNCPYSVLSARETGSLTKRTRQERNKLVLKFFSSRRCVFLKIPFSSPRSQIPLSPREAERESTVVKENLMQHAMQEAETQKQLHTTLEKYVSRI